MFDGPFAVAADCGTASDQAVARQNAANETSKRAFDLIVAAALVVATLPLMILIAVIVRLDGGDAFFRHTRIGRHGKPFRCLKFRSMATDADARLAAHLALDAAAAAEWSTRRKLARDPRVTVVGRVLRATSLDELPQLFNVLRGEMSLVGPRPVVQAELEQFYSARAASLYTSVRPGITGLWQVSGRSETTYEKRVALDAQYAMTQSFRGDLLLLLRTVPAVLARRGAV